MCASAMEYILAYAASELVNFRLIEFSSLCELLKISLDKTIIRHSPDYWSQPYVPVHLENDRIATLLVERSVLIKSVYHVWCSASSLPELIHKIPDLPAERTNKYINSFGSYKLIVSSANKKLSHEEKLDIIEAVLNAHRTLNASVSLCNPDYQLNVLLDFKPRNWAKGPPVREAELRQVFYGRYVASSKRKVFMNSYRLADRSYLGNTSMDVRLAAIMANVGLCGPGALVWDPFVGTGSILLAASLWGAFGAGSDIDFALLHGLGMSPKAGQGKRINGECLRTNYAQYGIRSLYLDVIVADAASLHRLLRVPGVDNFVKPTAAAKCIGLVDAVLTDPPYGFRESSRRIAVHAIERAPGLVTVRRLADITGSDSPCGRCVDDQTLVEVPHDLPHFPHKEEYPLHEANSDLLALSSRLLRPGGRLVFWVPVNRANPIGPDTLPRHPDLQLLAVCEQVLNSRNSRYMVAMRKREPNDLGSSDAPASEKFHLAELFPP